MKIQISVTLGLALLPLAGHAQFHAPAPSSAQEGSADRAVLESLLHAERPELVFHPDDVISVQVYGIKDYAVQQQVARDGAIVFPLVGKVPVAGLTVEELEASLTHLLASTGMIRDPQVTVTATSRPSMIAAVIGDVAKPGTFPVYGNRTLFDLLSEAGGLNNTVIGTSPVNSPASSTVTLYRPSLGKAIAIPLGADPTRSPYAAIPVFAGDQIRVGSVGIVYAVGAFKTQGAYPLKNTSPTTVLQLAALAGGIGYEGDHKDAHLIRTEGDHRYIVDVNVADILKGKVADVALQADDILFIPTNSMRAALKNGGASLVVGLASAYIYTHP